MEETVLESVFQYSGKLYMELINRGKMIEQLKAENEALKKAAAVEVK